MWAHRVRQLVADRLSEPVAVPLGASFAVAVLLALSAAVVGALLGRSVVEPAPLPLPRAVPVTVAIVADVELSEVVVHIAGAVRRPGVYVLDEDQRTSDLVETAGGATPEADLARINLAAPLLDGARVYVPSHGEDRPPRVIGPEPALQDSSVPLDVDINAASAADLERLTGIGPALAAEIVEHREAWGSFDSVDDLLDVRGIGPAKLSGFRDAVHVG